MAFRTPTLLSSTDRQYGQRAENTSGARLRGTSGGSGEGIAETLSGDSWFRLIATRRVETAGIAGGFKLLRRSQIGFGKANLAPFARNLTLMTLR